MNSDSKITLEDFQKVEILAGQILSAEKIPETDKLLKLSVDFGPKTLTISAAPAAGAAPESDIRQIISGIALHFPEPNVLVGKRCMFVTNLEPRSIRGFESNGMLLTLSTEDGKFSLLEPSDDIPAGTRAR